VRNISRFRWMSDDRVHKYLSEGFWRFLVYRGLLRFAVLGIVFITLVGLWRDGVQTFATAWWRNGSIGFVLGGIAWGVAVWLILKLPGRLREVICWILAIGIIAFVGAILVPDLFPLNF